MTDLNADRAAGVQRRLDDADAAIARHVASREDPDEARRAIDAALQAIYRARNGLSENPGFWDRAQASVDGCTFSALDYIRGRMEHDVLVEAHEDEILVPSDTLYASEDLYPGVNYHWLVWDEMKRHMAPAKGHRDKRALVEKYAAGRLVVLGLRRAVRHLRAEAALAWS